MNPLNLKKDSSLLVCCVRSNRKIPDSKWHLRRDREWNETKPGKQSWSWNNNETTMEALTSELDVQLKLMFTQGKTKGIVEKANTEGIERHRDALWVIVKRIGIVKTQIEQAKLESGVQVDELAKWSAEVEAQQATVDEEITYLSQTLVQINSKASLEAKKWEEELAERDWDKQLQFEHAQLEKKVEFEKVEEARESNMGQVAV